MVRVLIGDCYLSVVNGGLSGGVQFYQHNQLLVRRFIETELRGVSVTGSIILACLVLDDCCAVKPHLCCFNRLCQSMDCSRGG
jgi:hypothetical protein